MSIQYTYIYLKKKYEKIHVTQNQTVCMIIVIIICSYRHNQCVIYLFFINYLLFRIQVPN